MKALRVGSLSIFFLLACLIGSPSVQAKPVANAGIMPQASEDCPAGTGWRWVEGSEQPQTAAQAQDALARAGVSARVTALGYGEVDLCDTYVPRGVDLFISLAQDPQLERLAQAEIEWKIQKALQDLPGVSIGNVKVGLPPGETVTLHLKERGEPQPFAAGLSADTTWKLVNTPQKPSPREELSLVYDTIREKLVWFGGGSRVGGHHPSNETWEYPSTDSYDGVVINKKVYVVAYNPYVDAGKTQRLWDYFGWNSYEDITQGTIDFFRINSGGQIRYSVVDTTVLDEIPEKTDGFTYSIDEYIKVIQHTAAAHSPDSVNYNIIVNDPRLDICGKANRGEIDEVWVFNGPYYGFWESTLVGPGSYWYNSPPVPGPFTCKRMIPIMGPNPERTVSEHVEDFGHRTESTMRKVYKDQWEQNHTRNSWEKFALVDYQSPDYFYSGCGDVHFPPNGQRDYDWGNPGSAQTYCDDFVNYPNLHDPTQVLKTVTCSAWGCNGLDFFGWWYSRYPRNPGCGPDSVANNWWIYFANPELALNPINGCALNYTQHVYLPTVRR